jgi:hypothetical protein
MNYGLKLESPKPEDYIFGGNNLGDLPIQPDGQWDGWLPDWEPQSRPGVFDSYACVSFATLNCVEILERHEFGATTNFSERYLAKISATDIQRGNTPQVVAEMLRKQGCVEEKELPFDMTINSFETFYAPLADYLYALGIGTFAQYAFGHEFVPSNVDALKNALKFSPLLFTASAWYKDENGLYYRPQGEQDNHAIVCYGYEEGKYWKILDSYADTEGSFLKKVRWDSLPMQCKRFTLHKQVVSQTLFDKFIYWLRVSLGI